MSSIYSTIPAEGEDHGPELGFDLLDGDMKKVMPAGYDFSKIHVAMHEDGRVIDRSQHMQGVPVITEHLPKKIRISGPERYLKDFHMARNELVVSQKFKDVVETLEPDTHQFVPVEMQYQDGRVAETQYYWMLVCTRLFGMDIEHTTHAYNPELRTFRTINGNKYVGNLKQIGDHHIWVDVGVRWFTPDVSQRLKDALDAAGVNGIGYKETPVV